MKNVLLLLGLLSSIVSVAQTPFVSSFGERGAVDYLVDFTRSVDGNYLLHAYGNSEETTTLAIRTYQLSVGNGLTDSLKMLLPGSQSLRSVEEDGRGGAITCGHTYNPQKADRDILINYLDATGKTIRSLTFGTEMDEGPRQTGIDEQRNYFIAYFQGTTKYARYSLNRIRSFNEEGEMVYDIDLELPEGLVYDLVPLGDGELVVIGTNKTSATTHEVAIIKLAADGTVLWRKGLSYPDVSSISRGFLEGEVLYLIDYTTQKIISLDIQNGETLTDLAFPREVRGDFLFPFAKYQDDFWIMSRKNIYQLAIKKYGYKLVGTYPLEKAIISSARFYPEGTLEYLDNSGTLVRFDLATTRFTTLVKGSHVIPQTIQEEVVDVNLVKDKIITGIKKATGGFSTGIIQQFSLDGELQGSVTKEAQQDLMRNSSLVILEDGGFASARAVVDDSYLSELRLEVYDAKGELKQHFSLLEKAAQVIDDPQVVVLPGNKMAVYGHFKNFKERTEGHFLGEVDLANPNLRRTQVFDFEGRDQQLFGLQDGTVGLLSPLSDNHLTVRKISFDNGLVWETTKSFPELEAPKMFDIGFSRAKNKLVAAPGSENVLLGINIQSGDDPPVYHLAFFGADGGNTGSFTSKNTHLSAGTDFLNENQIVVVGCDWNAQATGKGDLYQLNYEVYDLSGKLVKEVKRPVAYQIAITNVEVLDNGFVAAYGAIYKEKNMDSDAILLVINQAGDIVKGLDSIAPKQ